jgi:CDP-glycerol glycerophosphotransferase (TagB/SpsB family)
MCSAGGVGRDLVPLLRGKATIIALQDFWGARLWTDWADQKFRPDFICVNDLVGKSIILDAWPGFGGEQVVITGYPALDVYAGFDQEVAVAKVRSILSLPDNKPIILFGGQLQQSGEALSELVAALNEIGRNVCLIPRVHPRMKDNAPEEVPKWKEALLSFRKGHVIEDSSACDPQLLIAASDIVVSMFSSMLVEAAVLRKPNISLLYPEVGMAQWLKETGGGMKEFPLTELGCSVKAANRRKLKLALQFMLDSHFDPGLKAAQERSFKVDGQNAERVAAFIRNLLL